MSTIMAFRIWITLAGFLLCVVSGATSPESVACIGASGLLLIVTVLEMIFKGEKA